MIVLSLGSFGVYQLQPPAALMRWAGGSVGGGAAGALFMGLTMGVVAAPCVGPDRRRSARLRRQPSGPGSRLPALLLPRARHGAALHRPGGGGGVAAAACRVPANGSLWTEHLFGCILLCLGGLLPGATAADRPRSTGCCRRAVAAAGVYLGFIDRAGHALRGFPALKIAVGVCMLATAVWLVRPVGDGPGDRLGAGAGVDGRRARGRAAGAARVRRRVVHPVSRDGARPPTPIPTSCARPTASAW